jgi:S1-C subfamily serine protease
VSLASAAAFSAGLLLVAASATAQPPALATWADDRARISLIERVKPSVMHIRATRKPSDSAADKSLDGIRGMFGLPPGQPQEGSGFVADSALGLVVTAAHIVERSERVEVLDPAGTVFPAEIALSDPARGLAVLRVARLASPALTVAPRVPVAGESLLMVGWMTPVRSLLALNAMAMGTLSVDRSAAGANASAGPYVALDRTLPLGSFGGAPVIDSSGSVVGLVTATYGRDAGPSAVTLMLPLAALHTLLADAAARKTSNR